MDRFDSHTERRAQERGGALRRLLDVIYPILRWIEHHVRGFYAAVGLFLAVGFVLALVAILGFAVLVDAVQAGETQRFDETVLLWLHARSVPWLEWAALEFTALGNTVVVWITMFIASTFLWVTRHRYSAALLWVAIIGAGILSSSLKMAFNRPRPQLFEWGAEYAGLSSFPSGHATAAVAVYATLAYLVARLEPTRLLRRLTLGFTAAVILLIGLSRMYLGVHYPSDVLAGYLAGFIWATFCATAIEAVRYFRDRKRGVEEQEKDLDQRPRLRAD
jgi:undecaprenyl-diphosphatase